MCIGAGLVKRYGRRRGNWNDLAADPEVDAFLHVDRVASKSNPVDGLSRGRVVALGSRVEGPWKQALLV